jgi:hypothetical protein
MLIVFELSMPGIGSWNHKWTGEDRYYAKVRKLYKKSATEILKHGNYEYNFGDGWVARIIVRKVDSNEAAKIRKKSIGLAGYDWMIDSIVKTGNIERGEGI